MGPTEAQHNVFVMTNTSVARLGLWDENIFPALCEGEQQQHGQQQACVMGAQSCFLAEEGQKIERESVPLAVLSPWVHPICTLVVYSPSAAARPFTLPPPKKTSTCGCGCASATRLLKRRAGRMCAPSMVRVHTRAGRRKRCAGAWCTHPHAPSPCLARVLTCICRLPLVPGAVAPHLAVPSPPCVRPAHRQALLPGGLAARRCARGEREGAHPLHRPHPPRRQLQLLHAKVGLPVGSRRLDGALARRLPVQNALQQKRARLVLVGSSSMRWVIDGNAWGMLAMLASSP